MFSRLFKTIATDPNEALMFAQVYPIYSTMPKKKADSKKNLEIIWQNWKNAHDTWNHHNQKA